MLEIPTVDPTEQAAISAVRTDIFLSRYALWVLIPVIVGLAYLSVLGYGKYKQAADTEAWPSTTGIVERVEYHEERDSRWTEVEYTYSVDGKAYENDKVSYNDTSTRYENARSFADSHKEGSEITVYYNPDLPEESLVLPGVDVLALIFLIGPLIWAALLLSMAFSLLRYNRFVNVVKSGDLTYVKDLCYNLGYGATPLRALLIAAEMPDDAILKEVIKGSTPKEIANVTAFCEHTGRVHACDQLSPLKVEETAETRAMARKQNLKKALLCVAIMMPLLAWMTYLLLSVTAK